MAFGQAAFGMVLPAPGSDRSDLVRPGRFEKRRTAVVAGNIRMVPARKLTVGALNLVRARVRRHAQNVVVVTHQIVESRRAPDTHSLWPLRDALFVR